MMSLALAWLNLSSGHAAEPVAGERFHPIVWPTPRHTLPAAAWRPMLLRFPLGAESLGNVPFQLTQPFGLLGLDAARIGEWLPAQSGVIPITDGGSLGALHLLVGLRGNLKRGTPAMAVAFHYQDGMVRQVRLAAGVHLGSAGDSKPLAHTASRIVWKDGDAGLSAPTMMVSLCRLDNPRPSQPLQGVQFVSFFSDATPVVLGATWESGVASDIPMRKPSAVEKKAEALPDDAWRHPLRFRITESPGGPPVTNAEAFLSIRDGELRFLVDQTQLNREGEGTLHYPPSQTVSFDLVVRANGYAPVLVSADREQDQAFPESVTIHLPPGLSVGGQVKDQQGKPIAGATVTAYSLTAFRGRSWGRIDQESARTDNDGRWKLSSLPQNPEGVDVEVSHPAFRTLRFRVEKDPSAADRWSTAALIAGTALAVLESTPQLTLQVSDPASKPLSQVAVSALRQGRLPAVPLGATDSGGQFTVGEAALPAESALLLEAPGFAPALLPIAFGNASESVAVSLARLATLRGVVLDQQNLPIAGAEVRLEGWNETPLFNWKVLTDDQGRFYWSNGVPGSVMLRLSKANYQQNRYNIDWNPRQELRLTMFHHYTASGNVVDAVTRKPIRDFRVLRGWSYSPESPMQWERYNSFRGRNGTYSVRLQNFGSNARLAVMIEAPGYLPAVSREVVGAQSIESNFELRPGQGLKGTVIDPEGKPVENVSLVLVSAQESVYLDKPGPPNRSSNYSDQTRSGADGSFEFQPRLFSTRVVAVHAAGFADVSVDELQMEPRIRLMPYGRIEGSFKVGGGTWKPTMSQLRLQTFWLSTDEPSGRISALSVGFKTMPDSNGRFVFDKVPPGLRQVSLEYRFTNRRNPDSAYSHDTMVYVRPGETSTVVLGEGGRLLRGKVQVSGADPEMIDWTADVHRMTWLSTQDDGLPLLQFRGETNILTRVRLIRRHQQELADWVKTPSGLDYQRRRHNYALVFRPDGSFEVENAMPGRYSLQISPYEHDAEGYNSRQLGFVSEEIQIPEASGSSEPFDLKPVNLTVRGFLKAGRKFPEFQVKGLDGKPLTHELFQNKVGILYFWSMRGMNDNELKMLRDFLQRPDTEPKVELLMWNIDGDPTEVRKFVEVRKVPGHVCALPNPLEHPLLMSLGVETYPSALVIDLSGRIIGFNIRGSSLKSSVQRASRSSGRVNR